MACLRVADSWTLVRCTLMPITTSHTTANRAHKNTMRMAREEYAGDDDDTPSACEGAQKRTTATVKGRDGGNAQLAPRHSMQPVLNPRAGVRAAAVTFGAETSSQQVLKRDTDEVRHGTAQHGTAAARPHPPYLEQQTHEEHEGGEAQAAVLQ